MTTLWCLFGWSQKPQKQTLNYLPSDSCPPATCLIMQTHSHTHTFGSNLFGGRYTKITGINLAWTENSPTCWSPVGAISSFPGPAGGDVECGLAGARTFSKGSPPRVVKLPELESKNAIVNIGPRIRMRDPEGLTTTGSFILGSPRSGRLMMTAMTEPRVVPMKRLALSMWSFLMAKESTNSTQQTPSCCITCDNKYSQVWTRLKITEYQNALCVTLIYFLLIIKRVTQFLITPFPSNEGKRERERALFKKNS